MTTRDAVLDGEIVCLDSEGHPQFRDPLFHRADPCFFAFDLLASNGKDLRLSALVGWQSFVGYSPECHGAGLRHENRRFVMLSGT
jgi:hypothetical protein